MPDDNRVLVTVLLHHDQGKTLDEIMAHPRKRGFYRDFPPIAVPLKKDHAS